MKSPLSLLSAVLSAVLAAVAISSVAFAQSYKTEYRPAPIDNPLKGLVPYAAPKGNLFPHSLEFSYIKFSDLVIGPDRYDWQPLEALLDDIKSRGNQTIFRVYLEYPGHSDVIPKFLINNGLKVTRWRNEKEATDAETGWVETPDYEDPKLRLALEQFIAALGKKFDGDPRIGYITAGLLGMWGEWHTYPQTQLWASKETQKLVLDAYELAFDKTPILLRYPAGDSHNEQASNGQRPFGYHDDSFAYATLDTGKKEDSWFFQSLLNAAGAMEKWKAQPIGGEIRPEVWGCCFDDDPCTRQGQSFAACRDAMHTTWLMDSGMFQGEVSPERLENAKREVQKMGYEFFVESAELRPDGQQQVLTLKIKNTGIAPFYHAGWSLKLRSLDENSDVELTTEISLTGILPGEVKTFKTVVTKSIGENFLIGVPNPMPGGKPLRFANAHQDLDQTGWLTIGPAR